MELRMTKSLGCGIAAARCVTEPHGTRSTVDYLVGAHFRVWAAGVCSLKARWRRIVHPTKGEAFPDGQAFLLGSPWIRAEGVCDGNNFDKPAGRG